MRLSRVTASTVVLVLIALAGGGIAIGLASAFAEIYEMVVEDGGVNLIDQPLLAWIVAHRTPGLNEAVTIFTTSGGPFWMPVITTAATALLAWKLRSWTPVIVMLIAVAGSLAMTVVGKAVVGRHRPPRIEAIPPYESSASFPSGHSLNSMVITAVIVYFLLTYLVSVIARLAALVVGGVYAAAMGLSRVYLGHHWLSDVVAAWALGLCWVGLLITAHRLALTHRHYVAQLKEKEAARRLPLSQTPSGEQRAGA